MMNKCIKCGSYAFNLYKENIDQGAWCDVHYWQGRAHRAEFLAEQPAQHVLEVRVWRDKNHDQHAEFRGYDKLPDGEHVFYTSPQPAQQQEPVKHELQCICGCSWEIDADGNEELVSSPPAQRKPLTDEIPKGVLLAISNAGLTLLKTQHGYELRKLGPAVAHGIKGDA